MNLQKPVFVTGGTGLLGSHLIFSLISKGERVRATCRKSSNREILKKIISYYSGDPEKLLGLVEWTECDLCDYDSLVNAMNGVGRVYHCAAVVSFGKGQADTILKNNVSGTSNIVRSCLENNIEKLCHVSSVAALGASDGELSVNETVEWKSGRQYPAYWTSKHLSEEEVWKGTGKGLNAVIVDPSIILGPGDWSRSSSAIFSSIGSGMVFYTDGIKAYVDVNDVVRAMIALMDSSLSGERFIVSSENLTNFQFFTMVARCLGSVKPFIKIPKALSPLANQVVDLIQFVTRNRSPLTRDILKAAWTKVGYDNSKIIRSTGMSFMPINKSVEAIAAIYVSEKGRNH